ncbi:hypothetical protein F5Y19DRAFT_474072 [Xylariaceae sp. FL1651]|nr:hypothetical protein F5Y19DRAFT_474072 [Xylariaceae sp. FL1651]
MPILSSSINLDSLGLAPREYRNIVKTQATTRSPDVHGKSHQRNERPLFEEDAVLIKTSHLLPAPASTAQVLTLARLNELRSISDNAAAPPGDNSPDVPPGFSSLSSSISSSVSVAVSSSVSVAVSSSVSVAVSTSVSVAVSTSVSSSVSNSALASASGAFSAARQLAIQSASDAANASAATAISSANARADAASSQAASISSSASSILAMVTSANNVASIQASASSAVEAAKSSASESAQSAINAARSSASAAVGDTSHTSQILDLNAGQLAGIIVAIILASSLLSALATSFILRYRRQRAAVALNTLESPVGSIRKVSRPTFRNFRNKLASTDCVAPMTAGHRKISQGFPTGSKQKIQSPTENPLATTSTNRPSFASPDSPHSTSDQIYPVSPLSDVRPDSSGLAISPEFGLGFNTDQTQTFSQYVTSEVPPIKFSLARKHDGVGSQRLQVVRVGSPGAGTLSDGGLGKAQLSSNISDAVIVPGIQLNARKTTNDFEGTPVVLTPSANLSASSPPIVPLRFSSLNAYKSPLTQNPVNLHPDDEVSFPYMSDMATGRGHPISYNHISSQPDVISQNLTRFQPGAQDQLPVSRFSVSPIPPSSSEHSALSSSPTPQNYLPLQEQPQISPLRPAPPNPSQLQSPVPMRPNIAANVASMDSSIPRTPNDPRFTLFPRIAE